MNADKGKNIYNPANSDAVFSSAFIGVYRRQSGFSE
jgi:hypothetical protein